VLWPIVQNQILCCGPLYEPDSVLWPIVRNQILRCDPYRGGRSCVVVQSKNDILILSGMNLSTSLDQFVKKMGSESLTSMSLRNKVSRVIFSVSVMPEKVSSLTVPVLTLLQCALIGGRGMGAKVLIGNYLCSMYRHGTSLISLL
jgi:hypothetical protein